MGSDRIPRAIDQCGFLYEYSIVKHGRTHRWEEYGYPGAGSDPVGCWGKNHFCLVMADEYVQLSCNNVLWISADHGMKEEDVKMES